MLKIRDRVVSIRGRRGELVNVNLNSLKLSTQQRAALNKLSDSGDFTRRGLRALTQQERDLLAKVRARVRVGGPQALIVRFDCKWVRID